MSVQIEQPIVYVGDRVKILKTKGSKKWVGCTALVIEVADGGQTIHAEVEGQSGLRLVFDPNWLELLPLKESKNSISSLEQQPKTAKPHQDTFSQQSTPSEEPYEFSKCTITVGIQFLPNDGSGDRQVVVGVRNHADPPMLKLMRQSELGELPPAIVDLLASLESDLPNRQAASSKRYAEEQVAKDKRPAVTPKPASQCTGSKQIIDSNSKSIDANTPAQMSLFDSF